jgi:hypothetical protein
LALSIGKIRAGRELQNDFSESEFGIIPRDHLCREESPMDASTLVIIVWEYPLMGGRFVLIRLASGFFLPVVAGLAAQLFARE